VPLAVRWFIAVALPVTLLLAELLAYHWPLDLTISMCDAHELVPAARIHGELLAGRLVFDDLARLHYDDQPPPLSHLLQLAYYLITGTYRGVTLVNMVPVLIITAAVFGFTARRYGWPLGAAAVLLTWSFPEMASLVLTRLGVELVLSAMVTLSIIFLLQSDGFRHRRRSVLLGISLALAALTKSTFPLHLAVPLAYGLIRALRLPGRQQRIRNAGLATLTGFLLGAPWYIANASAILHQVLDETVRDPFASEGENTIVTRAISLSARLVRDAGPLVVALLILLLALVGFLWWRRGERPRLSGDVVILLSPFVTLLLFSLLFRSAYSCSMNIEFAGFAPVLAIAICALLHRLPSAGLRVLAVAVIMITLVMSHSKNRMEDIESIREIRAFVESARASVQGIQRGGEPREGALSAPGAAPLTPCQNATITFMAFWHGDLKSALGVGQEGSRASDGGGDHSAINRAAKPME